MKNNLRFTSLLMVLLMVAMLTVPVHAAEMGGECGNLTWSFDGATLTITGQGKMDYGSYPPWSDCRNSATKVVIGEGITSVGYHAFGGFSCLQTVSLPSTVTSIGENAFSNCMALQNISLTHVTSIGKYAFSDCSGLTALTIPTGVTKISWAAFSGCGGLESVQFHGGITEISNYAFSGCVSLTSVTIPDSVTTIGGSAFDGCYRLSSVTLSKNLTSLGDNAFSSCPHLQKITIPDGVKVIEGYTFSGCSALKEVVIGSGVSTIHVTAFNNCYALPAFTLSSGNTSFSIDRGVLYNRSKTTLMLMPEGFQGSYTVLSGTTKIAAHSCQEVAGLTSVTLPNSITVLEDYAFCGCDGMTSIKLSNSLQTIGTYSLSRLGITEINIPASVTKIKGMAFSGCSWLAKITFTGKPPEIQESAFTGVTATVYFPGDKPGWKETVGLYDGHLDWVSTACKEHKPVTDPAKAPTCTESGLTEGSHCSVCFTILKEQQIVPAKGHSFSKWVSVDSEKHKSTCTVCGHEEVATHAWDKGTVIRQPNCLAEGEQHFTCTLCSDTKTETLPKTTTHNYGKWMTIDESTHKHTCADCGKEETENHTWDNGTFTKKPTCIAEGTKTYTCTGCGTKKTETAEKLSTHTYDHDCDTTCNYCDFLRTITHSYAQIPVSSDQGHWYQCTVCGNQTDLESHIPGNEPTEEAPQTCTACGYMLQPALGHTHEFSAQWSTDEQAHWHTCSGCHEFDGLENHSYANDCATACDICGYTRETSHAYAAQWEHDAADHWHSCTICGNRSDTQPHTPGPPATHTAPQRCTGCGYEISPILAAPAEKSPDRTLPVVFGAAGLLSLGALVGTLLKKRKKS